MISPRESTIAERVLLARHPLLFVTGTMIRVDGGYAIR